MLQRVCHRELPRSMCSMLRHLTISQSKLSPSFSLPLSIQTKVHSYPIIHRPTSFIARHYGVSLNDKRRLLEREGVKEKQLIYRPPPNTSYSFPEASTPPLEITAVTPSSTPLSTSALSTPFMRTGVLGIKLGMSAVWDSWGVRHAVTVISVDDCRVIQKKTVEENGYTALQIGGGGIKKSKNMTKAELMHLAKAGAASVKAVREFHVSVDCVMDIGTPLFASHFVVGQNVDVASETTIGKGFAGAMKRHGFRGLAASHGVSVSHRSVGSTGQCQDPGKVFKGKKMPGRMGGVRRTLQNLKVIRIDTRKNLLYVVGGVPGPSGGIVQIVDSKKKPAKVWSQLGVVPPLPTRSARDNAALDDVLLAPVGKENPYLKTEVH